MDLLREKLRAKGHHRAQVAAAMIGSAVVGGAISSSASKSAANQQSSAANAATQSQREMFDKTVANNAPFTQAGQAATSKLSDLLGIPGATGGFDGAAYLAANPDVAADPYFAQHPEEHYNQYGKAEGRSAPQVQTTQSADFGSLLKPFSTADFQLDPGIQFQTQQGNLALQNSQAAKDGVLSGGALKDLMAYNQGMAGTGYQSAFDRYMAGKNLTIGSLMGVAGLGQNAASNTGNNSATMSSGIAGTITGAGNAQAAGTIGSANALSGAASGAGNAYFLNSLLNNQGQGSNLGGPITTAANPGGVYSAAPQ